MIALEFLMRYAHVFVAIVLAGGAVFLRFVLLPAVEGTDLKEPLHEKIRPLWAKIVAGGIGVLLLSGLYNYIAVAIPQHKGDSLYHMLMGFKMLAALVVFFLASALSGKSPKLQKLRDNWRPVGGLLVLLLAAIIGIASFLKVRGVPDKTPETTAQLSAVSAVPQLIGD